MTDDTARSTRWADRFLERLNRRPSILYLALALLAFPTLLVLFRGPGAPQYAHDVFDDDVPRLFSIAADWRTFGPSLWDPHLTSGNALFAQFALPPLAPDVVLSFVLPPFLAYAANTVLIAWLAGWSMHLFLRDSLRLHPAACLAGGTVASLGFWHYIYGFAAPLLPLLLWSADRVLATQRPRRDMVMAIAFVAFLLLSSQIQIVLLDLLVVAGYVVAAHGLRRATLRRLADVAVTWVVGLLVAAPVVLSIAAAVPESQRTIWDLQYLTPPLGEAIQNARELYTAVFAGLPIAPGVGGTADIYGSYFLAAIGLPLLAIGLAAPRHRRELRFLLVLLALIPALDVLSTLAVPIEERFPLLQSFQLVRVRHLMPVVLAINLAVGVDWLAGSGWSGATTARRSLVVAVAALAAALVAVQFVTAFRHVRHPVGSEQVRAGWDIAAVALAVGLVCLLVTLGALLLAGRRAAGRGRRVLELHLAPLSAGIALVLLGGLVIERVGWSHAERLLYSDLASWSESVEPTAAYRSIATSAGEGRVLSIGEHANRALAAGLDAADGYETLYPVRYHRLFGVLVGPYLDAHPGLYRYFHSWGNRAYAFGTDVSFPIADLLGIRWFYVRGNHPTPDAVTQRFTDGDTRVYENPNAFSRAFLVHRVIVESTVDDLLGRLATTGSDELRSTAFVLSTDVAGLPTDLGAPSDGDRAEIVDDRPDRITVRTSSAAAAMLVLADTYASGWTADVDGSGAAIVPLDSGLRGVQLPAGEHSVTFTYRPLPTLIGLVVALIAVLATVAWALLPRSRV